MMAPAAMTLRTHVFARESILVAVVFLITIFPWIVNLDALAVISLGGLLAFAVMSPRSLVLAVPAMIGVSFKPFEIGELEFNVLEVLVVIAIIGYAPRLAAAGWQRRAEMRARPRKAFDALVPDRFAAGIALILLLGGIVSLVTVADPDHLRESVRSFRWTILVPIALFFLVMVVVRGRALRELSASLFIAGGVVAASIAVIDGLGGGGVQADSVTRLSGLAPHPNALAIYLERTAVFGILVAVLFRANVHRWWLAAGSLVALVTVLTFSRGAVMALVVSVPFAFVISRARRPAIYAAGVAVALGCTLLVLAPTRTLSLLGGGSGSLRLELWKSSVEMGRDFPLFGVGLDQFLYQYLPRYVSPEAWPERFTAHPHNLVLEAWLSLGIIGAAIVVLLALLWFLRIRAGLARADRISVAAGGALLAIFVHGLVDRSYFLPELAISTWLLIALLRTPGPDEEPASRSGNGSKG